LPALAAFPHHLFHEGMDLNTDPKLKEEIGHIMDSVHRMSEKEVEKIEKE